MEGLKFVCFEFVFFVVVFLFLYSRKQVKVKVGELQWDLFFVVIVNVFF